MTTIQRLTRWYESQCNGAWEHGFGVSVGTLDNPGWSLDVDLAETDLQDRAFAEVSDEYDHETNWMRCWKEGAKFHARCGVSRLEDALQVFLQWAERTG